MPDEKKTDGASSKLNEKPNSYVYLCGEKKSLEELFSELERFHTRAVRNELIAEATLKVREVSVLQQEFVANLAVLSAVCKGPAQSLVDLEDAVELRAKAVQERELLVEQKITELRRREAEAEEHVTRSDRECSEKLAALNAREVECGKREETLKRREDVYEQRTQSHLKHVADDEDALSNKQRQLKDLETKLRAGMANVGRRQSESEKFQTHLQKKQKHLRNEEAEIMLRETMLSEREEKVGMEEKDVVAHRASLNAYETQLAKSAAEQQVIAAKLEAQHSKLLSEELEHRARLSRFMNAESSLRQLEAELQAQQTAQEIERTALEVRTTNLKNSEAKLDERQHLLEDAETALRIKSQQNIEAAPIATRAKAWGWLLSVFPHMFNEDQLEKCCLSCAELHGAPISSIFAARRVLSSANRKRPLTAGAPLRGGRRTLSPLECRHGSPPSLKGISRQRVKSPQGGVAWPPLLHNGFFMGTQREAVPKVALNSLLSVERGRRATPSDESPSLSPLHVMQSATDFAAAHAEAELLSYHLGCALTLLWRSVKATPPIFSFLNTNPPGQGIVALNDEDVLLMCAVCCLDAQFRSEYTFLLTVSLKLGDGVSIVEVDDSQFVAELAEKIAASINCEENNWFRVLCLRRAESIMELRKEKLHRALSCDAARVWGSLL